MVELLLFFHLVGAILFFAGLAVAAVGLGAARRRTSPAEIAALLGAARQGVLLVGLGTLLVLAFGFWLVAETDHGMGEAWISAAIALLVVAVVAGAFGGQSAKRARREAERLAAGGEPGAGSELPALLRDRKADALNLLAAAAAVAILVLMVWKPGA